MLKNLDQAIKNKGITLKSYAAVLGISEKSAWNKVNEVTELTYKEARITKENLFPEFDSNWLFASDGLNTKESQ